MSSTSVFTTRDRTVGARVRMTKKVVWMATRLWRHHLYFRRCSIRTYPSCDPAGSKYITSLLLRLHALDVVDWHTRWTTGLCSLQFELIMAGFSGALKLTDLDDFITPSQVGANVAEQLPRVVCNPSGVACVHHTRRYHLCDSYIILHWGED